MKEGWIRNWGEEGRIIRRGGCGEEETRGGGREDSPGAQSASTLQRGRTYLPTSSCSLQTFRLLAKAKRHFIVEFIFLR